MARNRSSIRPDRIAFCLPALASGGMEQVTLTLIEALCGRDQAVDLVLERKQGGYLTRVPATVNIVELAPSSKWRACAKLVFTRPAEGIAQCGRMAVPQAAYIPLRRLNSLVDYLRREHPAVLFVAHGRMPLLAIWAREIAGVSTRVIIIEHSTLSRWLAVFRDQPDKSRRWQYRRKLAGQLYPRADAIAAVSSGVADDLAQTLGLDRKRITTLYNPVVSDQLRAQSREMPAHAWFGADQPPVILAAGRLVREKNFSDLITAFATLKTSGPFSARLMIVGEGEERDALQAQIAALNLDDDVCLPGWVDNPYAVMRHSAVFVLCSLFEGLGIVLIEAMACGCPVVAVDCPSGPREILDGGRYGRLVPMDDTDALADAIAATLDAPPDPGPLVARAEVFSVANSLAAYDALIKQVLHAGGETGREYERRA